jgi:hypothetical protein
VNRSLREREITIQTPFNTNTCCTLLSNVLDPFWHLTSIIILFKHFIIKIMHWKDKISLFFSLSKEGERERERDVQTCKLRAKKWKKKPFLNIPRSWNVKETEFWYIYIYIFELPSYTMILRASTGPLAHARNKQILVSQFYISPNLFERISIQLKFL